MYKNNNVEAYASLIPLGIKDTALGGLKTAIGFQKTERRGIDEKNLS